MLIHFSEAALEEPGAYAINGINTYLQPYISLVHYYGTGVLGVIQSSVSLAAVRRDEALCRSMDTVQIQSGDPLNNHDLEIVNTMK